MAAAELPLAERQAHILHLLRTNPKGMRKVDIAIALKVSPDRAGKVLCSMGKAGLAAKAINGGAAAYWTTPERAAAVRRLVRNRRRAKALARERRLAKEREQEAEMRELLRVKQSVVPAGRMPPPLCTAVNSVFALASV